MGILHWMTRLLGGTTAGPQMVYAETPDGNFHLIQGDALSAYVLKGEVHEPHFSRLVKALVKRDDNLLDMGANLGTHTVLMARHAAQGKVYSFEPLSLTFSQLQMNIHANGLTNVTPYKFALSDRSGEYVAMQAVDYSRANLNIGATRISRSGRGDGALSIRIDDLSLPKIAFAKIDIQGSELRALLGMANLIARDRPVLFVEIEEKYLREAGASSEQLITHLFSQGYSLFRIKTSYPCDHVAVPNERLEALEPVVTVAAGHAIDKLQGEGVSLTFGSNKYTYETYTVH